MKWNWTVQIIINIVPISFPNDLSTCFLNVDNAKTSNVPKIIRITYCEKSKGKWNTSKRKWIGYPIMDNTKGPRNVLGTTPGNSKWSY